VGTVSGGVIQNNAAINTSITAGHAAGRIVGENTGGVVNNNIALDAMTAPGSAKFNATLTPNHGTSTMDFDFRRQSTYVNLNWRFGINDANPWQIREGLGYPFLNWEQR